jgi:predicted DNA-binding transcriptional regulator AlpA
MRNLPPTGFLRLSQIIGTDDPDADAPLIPVSKTTWWEGVHTGRYPKPTWILGPRIPAWRVEDIRDLVARGTEATA